jgi:3-oxoacyl-[acyl-carrier-protein] synthase II
MVQTSSLRPRHRVVVTGMGAVTPVGQGVEPTWREFLAGTSGIGPITQFDPSEYPSRIAGEVKDFRPPSCVEPKEAKRMSRFELFALAATEEALAQARFKIDDSNCERVGVLIGTGVGSLPDIQHEIGVMLHRGGMRISPFFLPRFLANMGSAHVALIYGIRGYSTTICTACASGGQAIGEASEVIRRGTTDVMIAGGVDASICAMGEASFAVLRAVSQRNDDPTRASRPFDADRDGLVPSEAGAVLILESLEHALSRNATIIAELAGYGASTDAYHVVAPHPEGKGAGLAIRRALVDSDLRPADIDYINAHATSTQLGDTSETLGIKEALGEHAYRVAISATKSLIGHAMGGAGSVGAMASILAIRDGMIHPTINYERQDPTCDLDYVPNVARKADVKVALSNAFAFGGHNSVIAFRRYEG